MVLQLHRIIDNNKLEINKIQAYSQGFLMKEAVNWLEAINGLLAASAKFNIPALEPPVFTELSITANAYQKEGLLRLPFDVCYIEGPLNSKRELSAGANDVKMGVLAFKVNAFSEALDLDATEEDIAFILHRGGKPSIKSPWLTPRIANVFRQSDGHVMSHLTGGADMDNTISPPEEIHLREAATATMTYLWAALALINSPSADREIETPPLKLQKAREKRGKCPLFEHHVLKIGGMTSTGKLLAKGGTHASPRQHWRRGHVRVLRRDTPEEKKTLIPACLVSGRGFVSKDYEVHI
tara:strand:- start:45 stop:932 length:888 start_codon:yes stop_codon:yes gene_type:complete